MKYYYPPKFENLPDIGIDEEFSDVEFAALEEQQEDNLELIDLSKFTPGEPMRTYTVKAPTHSCGVDNILYHGDSKVRADWFLLNYPGSTLIVKEI